MKTAYDPSAHGRRLVRGGAISRLSTHGMQKDAPRSQAEHVVWIGDASSAPKDADGKEAEGIPRLEGAPGSNTTL